ncbi:Transcriptional regulatory protein, C terminal [Sulfitobacter brevis]|uniref:Transcriptional regulatory protein, C terminal n=1 Tax=Sulfitobacter brevis TaxID=74348 RepID=A0A1I1XSA4_9RHOB|nr:Transcriptional regulatory protein, C terminal [Sulfitobacter brevis]
MKILAINMASRLSALLRLGERKRWEVIAPRCEFETNELLQLSEFQVVFIYIDGNAPDGFASLISLKYATAHRPIIAILKNDCSQERARAWELGAMICLAENATVSELEMAAVAAVRQFALARNNLIHAGPIEMDITTGSLRILGELVKLPRKQFLLVERLLLAQGKIVTRDQLLNHLYDFDEFPNVKIIDVFICKTRAKFQRAAKMGGAIVTCWGEGYRLAQPQ